MSCCPGPGVAREKPREQLPGHRHRIDERVQRERLERRIGVVASRSARR